MTPIVRVAAFGAAGIALALVGAGVAYRLARHPADPDPGRGRVAATPAAPAACKTMVGALARAAPSSAAASATVKR